MDIEKLIEQLNGYFDGKTLTRGVALDAATALSVQQAENEKMRAELNICREKNAGLALALLTECAPNPDCLGDDEWRAIRDELEQTKRERDAAVEKIREWEKFDTYLLIHNLMPPEKWCNQKED